MRVLQRLRRANHLLDQSWRRLRFGTRALIYWVAFTVVWTVIAVIRPHPDRWSGTLAGLGGLLITVTVLLISRLRGHRRRVSLTKEPTA